MRRLEQDLHFAYVPHECVTSRWRQAVTRPRPPVDEYFFLGYVASFDQFNKVRTEISIFPLHRTLQLAKCDPFRGE